MLQIKVQGSVIFHWAFLLSLKKCFIYFICFMKKRLAFLFLLFFQFSQTFAQQSQKGLLWEISGNGISQPSYIFGTIHLVCPGNFFVPKGTEEKFKIAQQVFLEIDMDDPQMMMKTQKKELLD